MKPFFIILLFAALTNTAFSQQDTPRKVEIVFCLDMSASTNGLIDRFREHLWDYTNLFAGCQPVPAFRIGLVGFSRPSFKKENGYVKVLKDLTTDIESVSKKLFDLKTSVEKGDQYVGHALTACTKNISWSPDTGVIKIVFFAGNGLVNMGGIDYRKAAADLAEMGVQINTLFVTTRTFTKKEISGWEEIAKIGNGTFSSFTVSTNYFSPTGSMDMKQLRALNDSVNATYLYYGTSGLARWQLMTEQDRKIFNTNPEGFIFRTQFKVSSLYQSCNSSWDLVDFFSAHGDVHNADLTPALLPEDYRQFSEADLKKRVQAKKADRQRLLQRIKFVMREWEEKKAADKTAHEKTIQTFDVITMKLIKNNLEKRGYICAENK
jgi:hypothetical protein